MRKMRKVGKSNLVVSSLALGTMGFGWQSDEEESHKILDYYVFAGGNFIDTANVYSKNQADGPPHSRGRSEQIIGSWLAKTSTQRDQVVIATKVGSEMGDDYRGLSAKSIEYHLEESLKRLGTDYVDLYYAHAADSQTPQEETIAAFEKLRKAGKIRAYGCSNHSAELMRDAHNTAAKIKAEGYVCAQDAYNPFVCFHYDEKIHPTIKELQMGLVIYKSLAGGFLTGKYRKDKPLPSSHNRGPIERNACNERGWKILDTLDQIAKTHETTTACVALAWYKKHPLITSILVGARSVVQISETMKAHELELDDGEYEMIEEVYRSK